MIIEAEREGHVDDIAEHEAIQREAIQTDRLRGRADDDDIKELIEAYSDSQDNYDYEKGGRSLFYWSDALFTGDALYAAFEKALCGHDYNEFSLRTLYNLISIFDGVNKAIFQAARESTVCIYVHNINGAFYGADLAKLSSTCADEITFENDGATIRFWFD